MERGSGSIMDYTPGYRDADRNRYSRETISKNLEDANSEVESEDATDESNDTDSTDTEDTTSEIEFEQDSNADCPEDDQDWLWERLAMLCFSDNKSKPLDIFKGYIVLFITSESDKLFKEIMNNVRDADLPVQEAVQYTLNKKEKSIIASVNRCISEESLWCELSELGGKWNCQWLTGKACPCRKCDGMSILKTTEVLIKLFISMRKDDLIQQIEEDIIEEMKKEMVQEDAIDQAVNKYKEDILVKLHDAKDMLERYGWNHPCFS